MLKTLRKFQLTGARFLAANPHALLADDMGLGKTLQAIAAAEWVGAKNNLVVCPASVRMNWLEEIRACLGSVGGWVVISYDQARIYAPECEDNYDAIILDEAHFLKTPTSQRTQAIFGNKFGLARRARYKWALTGTPVLNRPIELYPLLKTLAAGCLKPYDTLPEFARHFCGAYWDGYGLNMKGAANLAELKGRLTPFMLRRTKGEVMPELPPKIISRIPLAIGTTEQNDIWNAESEIADRESYLSPSKEHISQLGDLSHLLHVTGAAKVRAAAAFIIDSLATVDKVVVFAKHREVIGGLAQAMNVAGIGRVVYHGGMNDTQKQAAINAFRFDKGVRAFIANIQAGGTGINGLQEVSSTVVFAELSWVPGEMRQAIDRLHRIGQQRDVVNIYLLHIPGSLESAVLGVQDAKMSVINQLVGA